MVNKQPEKCKKYLRWLRGNTGDLTEELESMRTDVNSEARRETISKMYIHQIIKLFLTRIIQNYCERTLENYNALKYAVKESLSGGL